MTLLQNLTPAEVSSVCLVVAIVALFLAIILTLIHYLTGILAGFAMGVAAGTPAWWPMMQEWGRDVAIPLLISAGALIMWGLTNLYERFKDSGIEDMFDRF